MKSYQKMKNTDLNFFASGRASVTMVLLFGMALASAKEAGLPNEPDMITIPMGRVSSGKSLELDFRLSLPQTQELNKGAPSFVAVFERKRHSTKWNEVKRFKLNEFFSLGEVVQFSKALALQADDSDLAVHATVFHCGRDHKPACFIQGFQGIARREDARTESHVIPFHVEGTIR